DIGGGGDRRADAADPRAHLVGAPGGGAGDGGLYEQGGCGGRPGTLRPRGVGGQGAFVGLRVPRRRHPRGEGVGSGGLERGGGGGGGRQRGTLASWRGAQGRGTRAGDRQAGSITPHTKFRAEAYVLTKEEGGRHTPFFTGYRPQFYFRTTDVTGVAHLPEGVEM